MATRRLYVILDIQTDVEGHDAVTLDAQGRSTAALWIESNLSSPRTNVEATVYVALEDMVLDRAEEVI